jgi:hypothetical protein
MPDLSAPSEDFAVLVGISNYHAAPSLTSPAADASRLASLLVESYGLASENVTLLADGVPRTKGGKTLTRGEIDAAFEPLLRRSQTQGGRLGRRLYLYFSGYGFRVEGEVGLLPGDWRPEQPLLLGTRAYADLFRQAGVVDEVVLFVDSGIPPGPEAPTLSPPPFVLTPVGEPASHLYAFAAEVAAYSAEVAESGRSSGFLTAALLSGLGGQAADVDGSISAISLAAYVEQRVRELASEAGVEQRPFVFLDPTRPIVFREASADTASTTTEETTAAASPTPAGAYPTPRISSDRWAADDALGYAAFARTVATLITHHETTPPLTIGIKAPWGAGKTSLMKRIQHLLDGEAKVTEGNESARRNRDAPVLLTLRQMLVALRTLSGKGPNDRPQSRLRTWWWRLRGHPPAGDTTAPAAEGSKHSQQERDVEQILSSTAARVSDAAKGHPRLQFTPPQPTLSETGAAAAIPPRVTVWFNAWKYQTSEQIWAGLAHCIIDQVTARMAPASRELFWLRLHASRVDFNKLRWQVWQVVVRRALPVLVICIAAAAGGFSLMALGWTLPGTVAVSLSAVSSLAATWIQRARTLGEKAAERFQSLVREPDYEGKLGFLHLVESDMRDVLNLVATERCPLVVFVDDLDRCAPRTVAEIVEAINLFLSGDYPNCIFVLGMEPAMVAAALEVANEDLVEKVKDFDLARSPVPLGWRFMEKIVQLPLAIPAPDPAGAKAYLAHLTGGALAAEPTSAPQVDKVTEYLAELRSVQNVGQVVQRTQQLLTDAPSEDRVAIAEASKRAYTETFTDRDPAISKFIAETVLLFQGNPRQLKRYVNLFRFMSTLRHAIELDRASSGMTGPPMPNDEALTKYIALTIHWPQAADGLRQVRTPGGEPSSAAAAALLAQLEVFAKKLTDIPLQAAERRWTAHVKGLGLEHASWLLAPEFREFLARGESLGGYEQCGLW